MQADCNECQEGYERFAQASSRNGSFLREFSGLEIWEEKLVSLRLGYHDDSWPLHNQFHGCLSRK